MEITLTRSTAARKSQRLVIYNIAGRRGSVQFLSTLFGGDQHSQGNPPESMVLRGEFAKPETDEERKARLAARPKLSEAEKIAKLEAQLAKRKAALTTGSGTPPAAQPLEAGKEQTRVVVAGKAAAAKGKGKGKK